MNGHDWNNLPVSSIIASWLGHHQYLEVLCPGKIRLMMGSALIYQNQSRPEIVDSLATVRHIIDGVTFGIHEA